MNKTRKLFIGLASGAVAFALPLSLQAGTANNTSDQVPQTVSPGIPANAATAPDGVRVEQVHQRPYGTNSTTTQADSNAMGTQDARDNYNNTADYDATSHNRDNLTATTDHDRDDMASNDHDSDDMTGNRSDNDDNSQASQLPDQRITLRQARDLVGTNVQAKDGSKLGDVSDFVVTTGANPKSYVVVHKGGVLGVGGKSYYVPAEDLHLKQDSLNYSTDLTESDFEGLQAPDSDHLVSYDKLDGNNIVNDNNVVSDSGKVIGNFTGALVSSTGKVAYILARVPNSPFELPSKEHWAIPAGSITKVDDDGQIHTSLNWDRVTDSKSAQDAGWVAIKESPNNGRSRFVIDRNGAGPDQVAIEGAY